MTEGSRTARLRTDHRTSARAEWVANAVRPDNTDSMSTTLDGAAVETRIDRETTGGLQTTVDDYIVNLGVATAVIDAIDGVQDDQSSTDGQSTPTPDRTVSDQHADNTTHE